MPKSFAFENSVKTEYISAQVIDVISEVENQALKDSFGSSQIVQLVKVKILSGKNKGKIVTIENQLTSNPAYDIKVKPNDKIVIDAETRDKNIVYNIADRERFPAVFLITALFLISMIIVGGVKGLNSLISFGIMSALLFFVFIPLIIKGVPILPLTIVLSIVSTILTMFIVGGFNSKSTAASIGTIITLMICWTLSSFMIHITPLDGFYSQESIFLFSSMPNLNFIELLVSSMIIASLGGLMDIGMSIASCIYEIKSQNPVLGFKELFKSGMNVGKDMIGTMANTIMLVYIGTALPLLILAANAPFYKLVNLNSIATEIIAAFVGSIGIVLCVPITALITAYLGNNSTTKGTKDIDL